MVHSPLIANQNRIGWARASHSFQDDGKGTRTFEWPIENILAADQGLVAKPNCLRNFVGK